MYDEVRHQHCGRPFESDTSGSKSLTICAGVSAKADRAFA